MDGMESWHIAKGDKEDGIFSLAIYTMEFKNFSRNVRKIFELFAENNGKDSYSCLNDCIAIITFTFENEDDYINFQKAFEKTIS